MPHIDGVDDDGAGYGVLGANNKGIGMTGLSHGYYGVQRYSDGASGVHGHSDAGGVEGESDSVGVRGLGGSIGVERYCDRDFPFAELSARFSISLISFHFHQKLPLPQISH